MLLPSIKKQFKLALNDLDALDDKVEGKFPYDENNCVTKELEQIIMDTNNHLQSIITRTYRLNERIKLLKVNND